MEASTTLSYMYPGRTVALAAMSPVSSVQELVFSPLPAAWSHLQDWTLGRFESPWNLS